MIPTYPKFAKLSLAHHREIKSFTSRYEPYSDFNFTSLFAWNTDGSTKVSKLNRNLIISLPDYLTGKAVYSILGQNQLEKTLEQLRSKTRKIDMVPEPVIKKLKKNQRMIVAPSKDHFDYVYRLSEHSSLRGAPHKSKRNNINRFKAKYPHGVLVKRAYFTKKNKQRVIDIFNAWARERGHTGEKIKAEFDALQNLLEQAHRFRLILILIFIDGRPAGFSINEMLNSKYAISHFHKSLLSYKYIDYYFTKQVAMLLAGRGPILINWEQDLGLPGLRELKTAYKPAKFLKKYVIKFV